MNQRPYISQPCVVCGEPTIFACADCAIESGGRKSVHVCGRSSCQQRHDELNPQHPKENAINE